MQTASVLIVDDDIDIALGLHDLLKFMGFQVTVMHTGGEAIGRARTSPFDAVLLDLMLPDMDGLTVLPTLRAIDPTLPVIITAFADIPKKHGLLTEGAFGHPTKPFDTEELKALVRRAIDVKHLSGEVAEARQALTTSEERFREVVETAPDAIVLADGDGHILSWNAAAASLFGFSQEEVYGKPLTLLMPTRDHRPHLESLNRCSHNRRDPAQRQADQGAWPALGADCGMTGLRKDGTEIQSFPAGEPGYPAASVIHIMAH